MSNLKLTMTDAREMAKGIIKARHIPYFKGSPGTGKSYSNRELADHFNLEFIDCRLSQMEPPDANGFPYADLEAGKSGYLPMDTFPVEGDPLPEGKDGWYILFDELPSASPDMQVAAYKILLDRKIGEKKLHNNVVMAAAGNNIEDNAVVNEMSSALVTRLIHINIRSDIKGFREVALKLNLDHRIRSYLEFKPNNVNNFNPEKLGLEDTYACERTWHFLSDIMKHIPPDDKFALYAYAGTVGEGVAREFIAFCKVFHSLPTISQITSDPNNVSIPTEPGTLYALTGSLGENADRDNIDKLMVYINRMPLDFQVVTLRQIVFNDRSMMYDVPAIAGWIDRNSLELF